MNQFRYNPARGLNKSLNGGGGFNKLSAGNKIYGYGATAPNTGQVGDKTGYQQRDRKYAAYKQALQNRISRGI